MLSSLDERFHRRNISSAQGIGGEEVSYSTSFPQTKQTQEAEQKYCLHAWMTREGLPLVNSKRNLLSGTAFDGRGLRTFPRGNE
jgi:hypothetical protein